MGTDSIVATASLLHKLLTLLPTQHIWLEVCYHINATSIAFNNDKYGLHEYMHACMSNVFAYQLSIQSYHIIHVPTRMCTPNIFGWHSARH